MLKNADKTITDVRLGSSQIQAIYKGSEKLYPSLVDTLTGERVGSWSYSGSNRSRVITPWSQAVFQNGTKGSVVDGSPRTASEGASSVVYGAWLYNWTTTNNSTRTRTVTHIWSDGATNSGGNQSETGGTRYLVSGGVSGSVNAGGTNSVAVQVASHDYWPNTSGVFVQSVAIDGVTASATNGFATSVSSSTITVTRAVNLTTNAINGTVDFAKAGFISASATGNNPAINQVANSRTTATEQDGYHNGVCGANYYFIDYPKLRTRYDWATGHKTYDGWYNGTARSQRIDGQCGWSRAWTQWSRTGETSNTAGTLNGYDCDGTYKVTYYREARYLQYPDGSGRTSTQYRGNSVALRSLVPGVCGYDPKPTCTISGSYLNMGSGTYEITLTASRTLTSNVTVSYVLAGAGMGQQTVVFSSGKSQHTFRVFNMPLVYGVSLVGVNPSLDSTQNYTYR